MKRFFYYLNTLFVLSLLNSCINGDEKIKKDIIGSFYYVENDFEEEDVIISIEGVETYNSNGTISNIATLTMTLLDEDKIRLKYLLTVTGTYEINNSHIIYDYNYNSISVEPQKGENIDFVTNLMYKQSESIIIDHFIPTFKQEMIADMDLKIVKLNEKYLVLAGRNGDEVTYKKMANNEGIDNQQIIPTSKVGSNTSPVPKVDSTASQAPDFEDFIQDFSTDKKYQLSHIKFPLNNGITKDKWIFLDSNLIFNGKKQFDDYILQGAFSKEGDKYIYEVGIPESELFYRLGFQLINDEWFMVDFIDIQEEINDMYEEK